MHGERHETGCPIADMRAELAQARKLLRALLTEYHAAVCYSEHGWETCNYDRPVLIQARTFLEATNGTR